jgi:hypothetical protein
MADFFNRGVKDEEVGFSKPTPIPKKPPKTQDMSKRELLEESIENQRLHNKYLKGIRFWLAVIGVITLIYFVIFIYSL